MKTDKMTRIFFPLFLVYFLVYWKRLYIDTLLPIDGNTLRLFYPTWVIGKTLLLDGFSLLWDPFRNMGQPFLADPQNHALYPIRFLCLFTNFLNYQRIFVASHIFLIGFFAYRIAKDWYQDQPLAWMAALICAFNGFVLTRVTLSSHFAALAWAPAVFYFCQKSKPFLLGFVLSLQWLAGFPPFFLITVIGGFFFALLSDDRKAILSFIQACFLFLGLCAFQILPFFEMLTESIRPFFLSPEMTMVNSLHPIEVLKQLTVPPIVVSLLRRFGESDPSIAHFYFGPFVLITFFLGALKTTKKENLLCAITGLGFLLSLGHYIKIYPYIPFITIFRYPSNWILITLVPIALICINGIRHLQQPKAKYALFALISIDLLFYSLPPHSAWLPWSVVQSPTHKELVASLPPQTRIFHNYKLTESVHKWRISSQKDWLMMKTILLPSIGPTFGIPEVSSYHILTSKRHLEFEHNLNHSSWDSFLFDVARIGKILTLKGEEPSEKVPKQDELRVIDNPVVIPRAFLLKPPFSLELKKSRLTPVTIHNDQPGDIHMQGEGSGLLVISESFYPGWMAQINGRRTTVKPFLNAFLSIPLENGSHTIRLHYRPFSFLIGLFLSLVTSLIIFGVYLKRKFTHAPAVIGPYDQK